MSIGSGGMAEAVRGKRSSRIYLAGPEVFLADAESVMENKKNVCRRYGMVGVSPLDNGVRVDPADLRSAAHAIYCADRDFMLGCGYGIANITPFRGVSVDPGTAFEIGYLAASGAVVFGYSGAPSLYAERVRASIEANAAVRAHASDGWQIESFGLLENLMVPFGIEDSGGAVIVGDAAAGDPFRDLGAFETCVRAVVAHREATVRTRRQSASRPPRPT